MIEGYHITDNKFLRPRYNELVARRSVLEKDIERIEDEISSKEKSIETYTKARWVLTEVIKNTQEFFKDEVEALITLAVRSVYGPQYAFKMEFGTANKFECNIFVEEDGELFKPEDENGGGVLDVLSFALKVVFWASEANRTRNVLILDEPMKFTGDLLQLAVDMIKEISRRLNIQVILITHDDLLAKMADTAYRVTKVKGKSQLVLLRKEKDSDGKHGSQHRKGR